MSTDAGQQWLFKEFWGFESVPVDIDFDIFMKVLLNCANGDGQLTAQERAWVVDYTAALGGPPYLIEELRRYPATEDIATLVAQRETVRQSARALVYDAIRACSADGELQPGERDLVVGLASTLGVPAEIVQQLETLYAEDRRIRQERLDLIWPRVRPY